MKGVCVWIDYSIVCRLDLFSSSPMFSVNTQVFKAVKCNKHGLMDVRFTLKSNNALKNFAKH